MRRARKWHGQSWARMVWLALINLAFGLNFPPGLAGQESPASDKPAGELADSTVPGPLNGKLEQGVEGASPAATALYGDGANLQNNREYSLAIETWSKFLSAYPDDPLVPRVHHNRGVCHMQGESLAEALEDFDVVVGNKDVPAELREEALLNQGWCHYSLAAGGDAEHLEAAATAFQTLLKEFPKSPLADQALFYGGESCYLAEKIEPAVENYRRLVEEFPRSERWPDAAYALGVALQDLGRHDDALQVFDQFERTQPGHELTHEVQLRRGESLIVKREFAAAAPIFAALSAIKDFPAADHAMYRQAACAMSQQQFAEGARLFSALPGRFPQSVYVADAWIAAGNGYYRAEMWDDALKAYAEARKVRPELLADMAHWSCRVLLKQQLPAEALRIARGALESTTDPELIVQLRYDEADAMFADPKSRSEALEAYKRLGRDHKDNPLAGQSLYNAAYAALDLREYAQCQELCREFQEAFPQHELLPDVRHLLCEAEFRMEHWKEAGEGFRQLIEEFPDHPEIDTWRIGRGRTLFAASDFQGTIDTLTPLIPLMSSATSLAEAWYLLGESQRSLKALEPAANDMIMSLKAYPAWKHADRTLLALAGIREAQSRPDDARKCLARLRKEFPQSELLPAADLRLADLDLAEGKLDDAEKHYAAASQNESSATGPQAKLGQAWVALRKNQSAEAERQFSAVIDGGADPVLVRDARQGRAVVRHRQKNFAGALEDVQAVLDAAPQGEKAWDARYIQALCQIATGAGEEAAATLTSLHEVAPDYRRDDLVLYELAWLAKETKPAESLRLFEELATKHPTSRHAAEAHFHLAESSYLAKKYANAAKSYRAALDEKSTRPELVEKCRYKLGFSLYHLGQWEDARAAFEPLHREDAQGEFARDARFMTAETWFQEQRYQAALDIYTAMKDGDLPATNSRILRSLHAGQAARQLNQLEKAVEWLRPLAEAPAESSSKWQAKFEIAQALKELNRSAEAAAEFAEVADHQRDVLGAEARYQLGALLLADGKHSQAAREFQRLMYGFGGQDAPQEIRTWQLKSGLEAGQCAQIVADAAKTDAERKEWHERATKCFQFVVEASPESPEAKLAKEKMSVTGHGTRTQ